MQRSKSRCCLIVAVHSDRCFLRGDLSAQKPYKKERKRCLQHVKSEKKCSFRTCLADCIGRALIPRRVKRRWSPDALATHTGSDHTDCFRCNLQRWVRRWNHKAAAWKLIVVCDLLVPCKAVSINVQTWKDTSVWVLLMISVVDLLSHVLQKRE